MRGTKLIGSPTAAPVAGGAGGNLAAPGYYFAAPDYFGAPGYVATPGPGYVAGEPTYRPKLYMSARGTGVRSSYGVCLVSTPRWRQMTERQSNVIWVRRPPRTRSCVLWRKARRTNQPIRQTIAVPQMRQPKCDGQRLTNEGCVDANKHDTASKKALPVIVFSAAYGISATVGNYFKARHRAPRCGLYCGCGALGPS